jgi:hypothetical protein
VHLFAYYTRNNDAYLLLHVSLHLPHNDKPQRRDQTALSGTIALNGIILVFETGYLLLSFLFACPFLSRVLHKQVVDLWQGLPHYVLGLAYIPSKIFSRSLSHKPKAQNVRYVYRAPSVLPRRDEAVLLDDEVDEGRKDLVMK